MKEQVKKAIKYWVQHPKWKEQARQKRLQAYFQNGRIPWSLGYEDYKFEQIGIMSQDPSILEGLRNRALPASYGVGIDERIVEYAWIMAHFPKESCKVLDAGSTFNFKYILDFEVFKNKDLSILTYAPEEPNFNERRISYQYADLRDIPYRDSYFDFIVSQSTIEHIDMDNGMYGYELPNQGNIQKKSYDYLIAISEMERILRSGGKLLVSCPYGVFENHGFFQQFDAEMIGRTQNLLAEKGTVSFEFFLYSPNGWTVATQDQCKDATSFNPHTGVGKGTDGAAHSRAICCMTFIKN